MDVLRRVLLQNYTRTITGDGREVIRRREKEPDGDGLPPGHARIASPYDLDARWGVKREEFWLGYKLHVTETCDDRRPAPAATPRQASPARTPGGGHADREHDKGCAQLVFPNLITNVATTDATVTDNQMTGAIHDDLAGKNLAPGRHYLDSGYLSAALVVSALTTRGIALVGPLLADTSAQARAGPGLCPRRLHRRLRHQDRHLPARQDGQVLVTMHPARQGRDRGHLLHHRLRPLPGPSCAPPRQAARALATAPDLAQAQAAARAAEKTIPFQADYARRAGVKGTMHQAASHGARRARYRGLPKTRLDHVYMACALNLLRLEAYWTGTPLDRRRTSHLARLELRLAA